MIVSLTTDFGLTDEYVGVMKAVILAIAPTVTIVDLSHGVEPQDVLGGALALAAGFPFFPPGSIHVAVVDPGVGGPRRIVAARHAGHVFIAPDNGLLTRVLEAGATDETVEITNSAYFRHPVSPTFHGRDVMAPAAAYLSRGVTLAELGPKIPPESLVRLAVPRVRLEGDTVAGEVLRADRFGNLMTNIAPRDLAGLPASRDPRALIVEVAGIAISGLSRTYAAGPPGKPIALFGSRGLLEIAVSGKNARDALRIRPGAPVTVKTK